MPMYGLLSINYLNLNNAGLLTFSYYIYVIISLRLYLNKFDPILIKKIINTGNHEFQDFFLYNN